MSLGEFADLRRCRQQSRPRPRVSCSQPPSPLDTRNPTFCSEISSRTNVGAIRSGPFPSALMGDESVLRLYENIRIQAAADRAASGR